MAEKILESENQTQELARQLISQYHQELGEKALLFALEGDLGAGKTTFTKGIGNFLAVKQPIRSPGYILVSEYPFSYEGDPKKLFHIDLWRVQDFSEAQTLELPQMLRPGNIVVVEWAQKIPEMIEDLISNPTKVKAIRIHIDQTAENERSAKIDELN